jgi:hypothetical protein
MGSDRLASQVCELGKAPSVACEWHERQISVVAHSVRRLRRECELQLWCESARGVREHARPLELFRRHSELIPLLSKRVRQRLLERVDVDEAPIMLIFRIHQEPEIKAADANNCGEANPHVLALGIPARHLVCEVGAWRARGAGVTGMGIPFVVQRRDVSGQVPRAGGGNSVGHRGSGDGGGDGQGSRFGAAGELRKLAKGWTSSRCARNPTYGSRRVIFIFNIRGPRP